MKQQTQEYKLHDSFIGDVIPSIRNGYMAAPSLTHVTNYKLFKKTTKEKAELANLKSKISKADLERYKKRQYIYREHFQF